MTIDIIDIIYVILITIGICFIYYIISRGIGSMKYGGKDDDEK